MRTSYRCSECSAESDLFANLLRAADLLLDHTSDKGASSNNGCTEGSRNGEDGGGSSGAAHLGNNALSLTSSKLAGTAPETFDLRGFILNFTQSSASSFPFSTCSCIKFGDEALWEFNCTVLLMSDYFFYETFLLADTFVDWNKSLFFILVHYWGCFLHALESTLRVFLEACLCLLAWSETLAHFSSAILRTIEDVFSSLSVVSGGLKFELFIISNWKSLCVALLVALDLGLTILFITYLEAAR